MSGGTGGRRIAILMHDRQNESHVQGYLIGLLAPFWREDGHELVFLFGTQTHEPADLLFVHVDLTVVPDEYIAFAKTYPVTINARATDIRKSTYSLGILDADDRWNGSVIVKTELNYAGIPEGRLLGRSPSEHERELELEHPTDYPIFDDISLVPREYFTDPNLVVQKFIPEIDRGDYCVRMLSFLGDEFASVRLRGKHPIVNGPTVERTESIDPDPEILALREEFGLEYGKFDYVMTKDGPFLLDANKTTGVARSLTVDSRLADSRRARARALYRYFSD